MKKELVAILILLVAAASADTVARLGRYHVTQTLPTGYKMTEIADIAAKSRLIDLGTVPQRQLAYSKLVLLNVGDSTIALVDATSDCGCTVVKSHDTELRPHSLTTLDIIVDPRRALGEEIHKRVIVQLRKPGREMEQLVFEVLAAVDRTATFLAMPSAVDLGRVCVGATAHATVTFRGPQAVIDAMPDVIAFDSSHQNFRFCYVKGFTEERRKDVDLRYSPKSVPTGEANPTLNFSVDADGPIPYHTGFAVTAHFGSPMLASPSAVYLPVSDKTSPSVIVTIKSLLNSTLPVTNIEADDHIHLERLGSRPDGTIAISLSAASGQRPNEPHLYFVKVWFASTRKASLIPVSLVPVPTLPATYPIEP
jgi:hypothetical protein